MSGLFVGPALPVIASRIECAKADYPARFLADWSCQSLFGERRRAARV